MRYSADILSYEKYKRSRTHTQAALASYTMSCGNVYRIVNGYDDCGNICGRMNDFDANSSSCHGEDMTEKPHLLVESSGTAVIDTGQMNRVCVEDCRLYSG